MSLESVIKELSERPAITESDARRLETEIQRFILAGRPSGLATSNFETSGVAPAGSVPLTPQTISSAIVRAAEAEDAHARRNAAIAGAVVSLLIGAGVTVLTGGTVTPAVAANIVKTAKPLLGEG